MEENSKFETIITNGNNIMNNNNDIHPTIGQLTTKKNKIEKDNESGVENNNDFLNNEEKRELTIVLTIPYIQKGYTYWDLLENFIFSDKVKTCERVNNVLQERIKNSKCEIDKETGNGLLHDLIVLNLNIIDDKDKKKEIELKKKYITHFLDNFHDINLKNKKNETPLGLALLQPIINQDIVLELISKGASLENVYNGKSVLHLINVLKNLPLLKILISKVKNVNLYEINTEGKFPPIYYAYKQDLIEAFSLFFKYSSNSTYITINSAGETSKDLRYNIISNNKEKYYDNILNNSIFDNKDLMIQHTTLDKIIYDQLSWIDFCIIYDNEIFAVKLLKKFKNLIYINQNIKYEKGKFSTVHLCVMFNRLNFLKLLNPFIKDIDIKSSEGLTPLYFAVNYNLFDIAKYLLDEKKADPNIKILNSIYPPILHVAAIKEYTKISELLLKYKANPYDQDRYEYTVHPYVFKSKNKELQQVYKNDIRVDKYKNIKLNIGLVSEKEILIFIPPTSLSENKNNNVQIID